MGDLVKIGDLVFELSGLDILKDSDDLRALCKRLVQLNNKVFMKCARSLQTDIQSVNDSKPASPTEIGRLNTQCQTISRCIRDIVFFYYHKTSFRELAQQALTQILSSQGSIRLLKALNDELAALSRDYEELKSDPQYKESLRELKKYNSKYLQGTQAIKNFQQLISDLQEGQLAQIPVSLVKNVKAYLADGSKENLPMNVCAILELSRLTRSLDINYGQPNKFNESIHLINLVKASLHRGDSQMTNKEVQEIARMVKTVKELKKWSQMWAVISTFCLGRALGYRMGLKPDGSQRVARSAAIDTTQSLLRREFTAEEHKEFAYDLTRKFGLVWSDRQTSKDVLESEYR